MRLQDATSKVSEAAGAFMIGMCPDHGQVIFESSVFWRKQFSDFSLKSWTQNFAAGAVLGESEGWLTLLALRIVNDVSYVTRINHEWFAWRAQYLLKEVDNDFSRQAQNLVNVDCDLSWQARHFVEFWEIAGGRNVASSDHGRIEFLLAEASNPGGQVLILINILDTFFIDIDLVLFYWFFQYELKNHIFTKNIEFFIDFNIDFKYWFGMSFL